ncbi:hypothetical protein CJO68_30360 [Burkholderia ubonensis]|nr:hypothetical protein CJO68_30360 [Burkholderia ubonensis]RQP98587.1 hypothetical protein DF012_08440 [Burkholderia ubonensis]
MKDKLSAGAFDFKPPVFETIEEFEIESKLYDDGTTVRVLLRRQLNHKPSRYAPGPFWLDLSVGGHHAPYYCVSEETAREAACRFLLRHVEGATPLLN